METPSKERKTKPAFVECAMKQLVQQGLEPRTNATYKDRAGMSASMSLIFPLVCYLIIATSAPT